MHRFLKISNEEINFMSEQSSYRREYVVNGLTYVAGFAYKHICSYGGQLFTQIQLF